MTTKSLKRFTEILKRNEGLSLIAIIALMVIMAVMGGVFSQIMGRWTLSAPATINSTRAYYLAETAAMFALQDARYRFYGGSFNFGTNGSPYTVFSSSTEEADYWFERPDSGYENDDTTGGTYDDYIDDDADDASDPTLYTIIATGKVKRDGTTVATRQIKIKAIITSNISSPVAAGVHTVGAINGTGTGFSISDADGTNTVAYKAGADWNYAVGYTEADEDGLIYRSAPTLDKGIFKALAIDQGHYNAGDLTIGHSSNDYPNGNYYYTGTIPNITYIEGSTSDLTIGGNRTAYGIYWVEGNVTLNANSVVNGIIICEGDITLNGTALLNGGIIQYGSSNKINDNGNPSAITIDEGFFDDLNDTIPEITIVSWQEAVSAN